MHIYLSYDQKKNMQRRPVHDTKQTEKQGEKMATMLPKRK